MIHETPAAAGASHLECTRCGATYPSERLSGLSPCCQRPLFARYPLDAIAARISRDALASRSADLWRYAEVLPVRDPASAVRLGEGWTPLLDVPRLADATGVGRLWIKDEAQNPTASFKARGLCMAVSRARELGATDVALASAGNAGSAAAAYAAAGGLRAHVVVPRDVPAPILRETRALGAEVELFDGLISDCAARVARGVAEDGWFDLSTFREPYRAEGKKTMGYELAEQLGWRLPDAIVYPCGGGMGVVGIWKAFDEMERMGWIGSARPKMFAVQAAGCAPLLRAWERGAEDTEPWEGARTAAQGMRVPRGVGHFLVLGILRASGGGAVGVHDEEMVRWSAAAGRASGVYCALEGGAAFAAVPRLRASGALGVEDEVVVFNTASGLKDPE